MIDNPEIEIIEGSARQTTELAIRRRQLLAEETKEISDLALRIAVALTPHRTCFNEMGHGFCSGCEDVWRCGQWIDKEMDRASVAKEARKLPWPTREEHER